MDSPERWLRVHGLFCSMKGRRPCLSRAAQVASHDQTASLRAALTGATQVLSLASIFRRAFAWQ